ncbi:hypothetical protein ACFWGI_33460 [Streptomyces niveus]|uniref:hypothetical protein n=1 Tax=Streptomyces niveus TaxID=193462 RepID=UPI00365CD187
MVLGLEGGPYQRLKALDQPSRARQYVRGDSEALNREDTTNGRPGVPLQLRIMVLDAERGAPSGAS